MNLEHHLPRFRQRSSPPTSLSRVLIFLNFLSRRTELSYKPFSYRKRVFFLMKVRHFGTLKFHVHTPFEPCTFAFICTIQYFCKRPPQYTCCITSDYKLLVTEKSRDVFNRSCAGEVFSGIFSDFGGHSGFSQRSRNSSVNTQ